MLINIAEKFPTITNEIETLKYDTNYRGKFISGNLSGGQRSSRSEEMLMKQEDGEVVLRRCVRK